MPTPTPAQLDVLARARKRLPGLIARRGIDDLVLTVTAAYDALYDAAASRDVPEINGLTALVDATIEAPVVSPTLLANARAERARRTAVNQ